MLLVVVDGTAAGNKITIYTRALNYLYRMIVESGPFVLPVDGATAGNNIIIHMHSIIYIG